MSGQDERVLDRIEQAGTDGGPQTARVVTMALDESPAGAIRRDPALAGLRTSGFSSTTDAIKAAFAQRSRDHGREHAATR